jgi:hypothetical protein
MSGEKFITLYDFALLEICPKFFVNLALGKVELNQ